MLPRAIVRSAGSAGSALLAWWGGLWRGAATGLVLAVLVGVAVGVSKAGCRNGAITYAKALWPEASCTATHTSTGCSDDPDVAVCRVYNMVLRCVVSTRFGVPECEEVTPTVRGHRP